MWCQQTSAAENRCKVEACFPMGIPSPLIIPQRRRCLLVRSLLDRQGLDIGCQSRIARTLPADQKPECRPYWEKGDPSMPLPFDLTEIVSELRGLLLETRP
ncbi:hypothetical protein FD755_004655 [Muntiacus reevesi]|uniref:Alpha-ketoglutarate-dependent dioxygenase FTO C-terminal domain-containing protein n=1 Tax=Muntiacus reevesi TaxID=9886 RepID=A0A5J5MQW5_MUNRE|nr:hypothetical protein FD755_004655 [Muntiacus reevesi]